MLCFLMNITSMVQITVFLESNSVSPWRDFWMVQVQWREAGKLCMEHGCYSIIPAGMGDVETLPREQLGPVAMLVPPLCAQKAPRVGGAMHITRTQSSSWLRTARALSGSHFMEFLICFMDINSSVCANLFTHSEEVACKGSCSSLHRRGYICEKSASPYLFLICCKNLTPFLLFPSRSGATLLPFTRS